MKILIVTQRYWPENFRITDIAETLSSLGNEVTVLTGLPNYPDGYVLNEYNHGKNRIQNHNGIKIIRAKEIGRRYNIIFRLLNYWSFQHYGKKMVKKLDNDFDVVLINELSPIMSANPGLKYAKKYGKRVIMYEMDLWPESLLAGGITRKSIIYKHYERVSAKIYSKCDKILVSTKEHIQYIKELPNCEDLDIEYLAQYAETIFEKSNFGNDDNGILDLMFAGNIGKAQSVDTLVRAAALLKDNPKIKFHIVGSGSELDNIKKLASNLNAGNIVFYGQKPLSEMPRLYKIADAMLVSLEDKPYANMTVPGKVQSYMAVGKPIIGSVNGSCANFIKNNAIGYSCSSGNYAELAKLISNIDIEDLIKIGENSREVYFRKYSKQLFISRLIKELNMIDK